MKKNKNKAPPPQITEKAQIYLNLWISLNKGREEKEIDDIRHQMKILWNQMDDLDKKMFKHFSDEMELKYIRNKKNNK